MPPFADLGDLGIDMRIGGDLGIPPVDVGVERAMEEVVADLQSSASGSEDEETESDGEAETLPRASGPIAAELLDEGGRALEEDREAAEERAVEDQAKRAAAQVTISYGTWEHYVDRLAGPVPTFNYQSYLQENPYARLKRSR